MSDLLSIEEEAAACRAAFAGVPIGAFAWCCHHGKLCEPLTELPEARIIFILNYKVVEECARRLREFRPVRGELPVEWVKAHAELDKAYAKWDTARDELTRAGELDKVRDELNKAYAERDEASIVHAPALEALHRAECPDSAWNGWAIFARSLV